MPDPKASILIVEDEEPVRTSLAEILKVLGHRVRCAADGLAALVEINQEVPEILLSDLNMPGMSGFELLPLVRLQFPIVRVIAMSGAFCGQQVPDGVTWKSTSTSSGNCWTDRKGAQMPRDKCTSD